MSGLFRAMQLAIDAVTLSPAELREQHIERPAPPLALYRVKLAGIPRLGTIYVDVWSVSTDEAARDALDNHKNATYAQCIGRTEDCEARGRATTGGNR